MDRDFLDFIIDVRNRPDGAQRVWEFLKRLEQARKTGNDAIPLNWLRNDPSDPNGMGISYSGVTAIDISKLKSIQEMGIPVSAGPDSY